MEGPQDLGAQVIQAVEGVQQATGLGSGEGEGHGVDGEIPPGQVGVDVRGLGLGQGAGVGVALPAGGDQVQEGRQVLVVGRFQGKKAFQGLPPGGCVGRGQPPLRGSEAGMGLDTAAKGPGQMPGQFRGPALQDHVEIQAGAAQEQVPHEAAHQVGGHIHPNGLPGHQSQQGPASRRERGFEQVP